MHREFKFRVWDQFNGVMMLQEEERYADSLCKIWVDYDILLQGQNNPVMMQYTGIKDKNEVEIYEGDIVNQRGLVMDIKFRDGVFIMCTTQDNGYVYNPYATDFHYAINQYEKNGIDFQGVFTQMEVIGNIYQNPELLKQ